MGGGAIKKAQRERGVVVGGAMKEAQRDGAVRRFRGKAIENIKIDR